MKVPAVFTPLVGNWRGTNPLWLSPEKPAHVSESTAGIALAARGEFATIRYTWAYKHQVEECLLVMTETPTDQQIWPFRG